MNGRRHRINGPAVEWADGAREYYVNGERHRIDGPALKLMDGSAFWYFRGVYHRTPGPAVENADGSKEWWVDGQEICTPYSHVLTVAFARGLAIREEAMLEMVKATRRALSNGEQIGSLQTILHKHWPTDVKKILASLFMDADPAIQQLAFLLLGPSAGPQSVVRL